MFGGLPALGVQNCIDDMTKAGKMYERQGSKKKGVSVVLAACYKLAGRKEDAATACKTAAELPAATASDRLDETERADVCASG